MRDVTLAALLRDMAGRLHNGLSDGQASATEAAILLSAITGMDRSRLILNGDEAVSAEFKVQAEQFIDRRLAGEPVFRILGRREFHGLDLKLSADTLEPRDDTETLIDAVLEQISNRTAALRFADLGTGTGAIALALLSELPNAMGLATDISQDALDTALLNANTHGFSQRLNAKTGSWCEPLEGQFNFLVSNPPYIASHVVDGLSVEVLEHDPRCALDGGSDGLDAYRELLAKAALYLKPEGFIALEIGYDQAETVTGLAADNGWQLIALRTDLGGRDRALVFTPLR